MIKGQGRKERTYLEIVEEGTIDVAKRYFSGI